jgi:hypothetical protein
MAFKVSLSNPAVPKLQILTTNSLSFNSGELIYRELATGYAATAVAASADATIIEGIVTKTQVTAASGTVYIDYIPLHSGMYVIADCTNATAENQLNKNHLLTNCATVNNTSTHSADKDAVFVALRVVGSASDKKLFGYIAKVGQLLT